MATRRIVSAEQQPDPADQATLDINETADKAEAPTTPKHSRAKRTAPAPAEVGTTETAETETAAAAAAKSGGGSRSARAAAPQTPVATEFPDTVSSIGHSADTATATASVVLLDAGLNVIEIAGPAVTNLSAGDTLTPLIRVSEWPSPNSERLTILSDTGIGEAWVKRSGGVVVVRTPPGGGRVVVTVFGPANAAVAPATITVRRIEAGIWPEGGAAALSAAQPVARDRAGRDIAAEILLHIERVGDRMQPNHGWVGARGEKKRLEAFGIRPLGGILPRDLHYKGLHAGGAETPWIPGPQLCGTRGRGLPLIGFAIRVAPHLQNRFDVIYQGSFFASGVVGPNRNGEPCRPPLAGDPLEAMSIRITERTPE